MSNADWRDKWKMHLCGTSLIATVWWWWSCQWPWHDCRCCCTTCISASVLNHLPHAICHFQSLDTFKTHLFFSSLILFSETARHLWHYSALQVIFNNLYTWKLQIVFTDGRAYATVSVCLSSVTLCIVAKQWVLEQKLLLTAHMKSYMRNWLVPKWMTLTFV